MEAKCPRCKNRFAILDSAVGQRGQCAHCQFAFTLKPARPIWVSVTIPLVLVAVAVAAVFIVGSLNSRITITQKTETGETEKVVLHVDHAEYVEKTHALFDMFQHMNAETDMAAPALKKLSYKGFLEKFGNPADVLRQFNVAQNSLSDDEKKLGSWLCATSALAFFQAAGLEKLHNETPGEMKDYNENTVAWNLKAFAASWKLATQCLNAGDELVVPLDCPMCEGEKQVACPCCAGVKTVIDEDLGRSVPCKVCKGIGKVTCPVCNGEGKITH